MKLTANSMADINDVYTWMTSDGAKVNLAMTVSPAAATTATFGPSIQYVFHIEQHPQFGMAGTETKIICTFINNMSGQCWVVDKDGETADYVTGDFSMAAGKASGSNKVRVFAGRRSDPFFFNLSGFLTAKRTVNNASLTFDAAKPGCPQFTVSTVPDLLRTQLAAVPDNTTENSVCAEGVADCFATFNTMAIVIQIDKDLVVDTTNKFISVWASTHAAP